MTRYKYIFIFICTSLKAPIKISLWSPRQSALGAIRLNLTPKHLDKKIHVHEIHFYHKYSCNTIRYNKYIFNTSNAFTPSQLTTTLSKIFVVKTRLKYDIMGGPSFKLFHKQSYFLNKDDLVKCYSQSK